MVGFIEFETITYLYTSNMGICYHNYALCILYNTMKITAVWYLRWQVGFELFHIPEELH